MLFTDTATIVDGAARITRDGYFVADARVAQADNVQAYRHDEIGQPAKADGAPYMIGRPRAAVFDAAAKASIAHRPITIGHPSQNVSAKNWKKLAVGDVGDSIVEDGNFLRVPLKLMDSAAIDAMRSTHKEFSLGYTADLDMTPAMIGDQQVDGVMTNIRVNHLAIVPAARGGPELRIVDERPPQLRDEEKPMNIKIGDAEVDLSDGAAVAVAIGSLNTKLADAETKAGALTADLATARTSIEAKDGEIAGLTQKLADAVVTPAKLQELATARAATIADAKAIAPAIVTDGKTDAEIRKGAVTAKLGDAAKDMTDAAIEGAFTALKGAAPRDPVREAIRDGLVNVGDAAEQERQALASANDHNAWRTAGKAA